MKSLVLATILVSVSAVAAEQPVETLEKDTAGLLFVVLNNKPMGFVFVSKTGQILPESTEKCQQNEACTKLVQKLIDAGHVTTLQLGEAKPEGVQS